MPGSIGQNHDLSVHIHDSVVLASRAMDRKLDVGNFSDMGGDIGSLASPAVRAGLLLLARSLCASLQLAHPDVASILQATGASRACAYEYRKVIARVLATCERRPGRPRQRTTQAPEPGAGSSAHSRQVAHLQRQCLEYVMNHPGAVAGSERRRWYSPGFRERVLELCADQGLSVSEISAALGIPFGTIRRWLARDAWHSRPSAVASTGATRAMSHAHINTSRAALDQRIVREWLRWHGPFTGFCTHLREHGRVPLGRTAIAGILARCEVRPIRRRRRTSLAAVWRDSFERFFPGAQWVGDGAQLTVWVDEHAFVFNLQLMVDADTGALVGMSIRNQEDSDAVIQAFTDGVIATGSPPLAVLLDNHACNHSGDVARAMGDTMLIFAAPGRPQHKAHVEGAFGLFAQTVPTMRVSAGACERDADERQRLARQILEMVVTTWARTLNHRPRKQACGRTRVRAYQEADSVDSASVQAAQRSLSARADRTSKRTGRRTSRTEVAVAVHPLSEFVRDALVSLELARRDDWHDLGAKVLRFAHDVVLDGLSIYTARRDAGTLPDLGDFHRGTDMGGRYLLGILSRLQREWEGRALASQALALRRAANASWWAALTERRTRMVDAFPEPQVRVKRLLDLAVAARSKDEHEFWFDAAMAVINAGEVAGSEPTDRALGLYRCAARHVMNSHEIRYERRLTLIRVMAARVVPLRCARGTGFADCRT